MTFSFKLDQKLYILITLLSVLDVIYKIIQLKEVFNDDLEKIGVCNNV
jgi:hypothetical protein